MNEARVIDFKFCSNNSSNNKENRYVLHIVYNNTVYYVDVTEELEKYGIEFTEQNFRKLKITVPEYVTASFCDIVFRISNESMKLWMKNYDLERSSMVVS